LKIDGKRKVGNSLLLTISLASRIQFAREGGVSASNSVLEKVVHRKPVLLHRKPFQVKLFCYVLKLNIFYFTRVDVANCEFL